MHSEGTAGRDSDHGQGDGSPRRAGDFLRSDSTEDARPWPETQPTPESSEPSVQAAAPAPHKVIDGRYELLHSLGRGGMGEVWKALDTRLDRHVAVKGLLGRDAIGAATQEKMMQRARREAAAIAKIRHQNVVAVHDRVESGNQVWIVMDLLNARSLADLMREERRLPVRRTAAIGLQVLGGLRAVHEARVVHRDVKPANILFAKDDFAILADFGIATFDGAVPLTRAGELIGTFKYLAPELLGQTSQESAATPASDLWSLGVTLYEMVEGRHPFDRPNEYELLVAACQSDPLPMEHGEELAEVVGQLMHKDPGRRLGAERAEEMLQEILRTSTAKPDPVRPPAPVKEKATKPQPEAGEAEAGESEAGEAEAGESEAGEAEAPAPVPAPVRPQAPPPSPPQASRKRVPGRQKLLAVAVCAALVAGLGWFAVEQLRGDGDPGAGGRPGQGPVSEPYIKTHPVLKVGVKADQPGLSEKTKNGKYRGYEIDVAYAIAQDMGYSRDKVTFEPVSSENRSTILQKGDVDLVIATYSITEERKHAEAPDYSVAFAGPYYVASRSFMVRKKAKAVSIDDTRVLEKKKLEVCTARSSTYEAWLPKAGYNMTESLPSGYDRCVHDLLDPMSPVYAVSTDDVILAGFVKNNPTELKRLDSGPGAEGYGVAMNPDEKGLKGEVCSSLRKIMTDGVWEKLYADHLAPLLNRVSPPNKPKLTECPS
ncbi:serine/threonine-protein kinase [Streptomyces sp. NBC_00264]|uniref:serine/threonine-protein kinase n=1 Tax=unclassified Streptomyces TaxID=2593676 RepID=UPI00224F15BC|nr:MULTISPECIES: serine/threonine-protein kinase [unclassified Streptomyces]MCX5162044.1 serine/threonine-protein kinase [Streptomyces sp. NBC_00305]MCX5220561.1 serine/threonine-protein kinase [Streptomyces sp. NBC_00264]